MSLGEKHNSNAAGRASLTLFSLAVLMALALAFSTGPVYGFSRGPEPKLTGGFREETCLRCHSGHSLNDGHALGGFFQIDGVPRNYKPGQTYALIVMIAHPAQSRWGYQLSARFSDSGKQAGSLAPADESSQMKQAGDLAYATHTATGSRKGQKDGPVEFRVRWTAPAEPGGMIVFNAAGNAADGSDSPTGDFIYTAGNFSTPQTPPALTKAAEPEPVEIDAKPAQTAPRLQDTSKVVSLPAPVDLKKGSVEIHIQHRFVEPIADSSAADAFGIDSGANISLGVNYALSDRLSAGAYRARIGQIIAFAGTYEIQTKKESKWKMSLYGGVEGRQNFHSEYSPFLQLPTAFDYKKVRFNLVPTVVFNSRNDELVALVGRRYFVNPGSNHTLSLGLGTDIALSRKVSLMAEYVPRLAGFGGFDKRMDQVAGGLVLRTWGHVFSITVARSLQFTPAAYAVQAESADVSLGFNIYRRMR